MPWTLTVLIGCFATGQLLAESPDRLLSNARRAAAAGDANEAVRLASLAIEQDDRFAEAFYLRGRQHFRLGKISESVADFDRFVQLRPQLESRQWERGIACYYAAEYEKGTKQFELYQTYHNNDVENSVWRYLCMVPTAGVESARAVMLPIEQDRRVPMMQIYDLYRGKLSPERVLSTVEAGDPTPQQLAGRLFYAHLYLGLYYESIDKEQLAQKYIALAADKQLASNPNINHYMWDVARVHAELRQPAAGAPAQDKP